MRLIKTQEASVPEFLSDLISFRRLHDFGLKQMAPQMCQNGGKMSGCESRSSPGRLILGYPAEFSGSSPVESRWNARQKPADLSINLFNVVFKRSLAR